MENRKNASKTKQQGRDTKNRRHLIYNVRSRRIGEMCGNSGLKFVQITKLERDVGGATYRVTFQFMSIGKTNEDCLI